MRPICLGTNAYVSFKRGPADGVEVVNCAERLLLPVPVMAELLAGFACGSREGRNQQELSRFLASPRVVIAPMSAATADADAPPLHAWPIRPVRSTCQQRGPMASPEASSSSSQRPNHPWIQGQIRPRFPLKTTKNPCKPFLTLATTEQPNPIQADLHHLNRLVLQR